MASTQNKNTPNDYCLEQRQFALGGKYTTYEYSQYGHAYNPAMPCVGIIPTNLSRDVYSKNYIDIESSLLGINSTNELIFNVSIYPNPSNGFFNIYTDSFDGSTRVTVHSIDGNLIKSYYFNSSSEMSNTKFDLSNLSSGIYFVNIDNKKGTGTKKIIID